MARKASPYDEYDVLDEIGDGSFGSVHHAKHKKTGHVVAIKKMKRKFHSLSECTNLREYKALRLLSAHANIVQLHECFLSPAPAKEFYFVMEYMDGGNLYQLMKERRAHGGLERGEVRRICSQILQGLSHMHRAGLFHRDMKPENLLIRRSTERRGPHRRPALHLKIADFGLAREIKSRPPYTEYVSTRWYRAPEVLLRSTSYSSPVDIWAVGTILAELVNLRPLFPGQSEVDQVFRICEVLGCPGWVDGRGSPYMGAVPKKDKKRTSPGFARKEPPVDDPMARRASRASIKDEVEAAVAALGAQAAAQATQVAGGVEGGGDWKEGIKLAHKMGFKFPMVAPHGLQSVIPSATPTLLRLLTELLRYDSKTRPSADEALSFEYFRERDEQDLAIEAEDHSLTDEPWLPVNEPDPPASSADPPLELDSVPDDEPPPADAVSGATFGVSGATLASAQQLIHRRGSIVGAVGLEWDRRPSLQNLRDPMHKATAVGRGIKPIDTAAAVAAAATAGRAAAGQTEKDFNLPMIPLSPLGLMSGSGWDGTEQAAGGEVENVVMGTGSAVGEGVAEERAIGLIDGIEDVNDVAARAGGDVVMAEAVEVEGVDVDGYERKIDALLREIDSVNADRKKTKHKSGPPSEMSTPANTDTLASPYVDDAAQPEAPSSAGSFFFRKSHRSLPPRKAKQSKTTPSTSPERSVIPPLANPDRMDIDTSNIYLDQLQSSSRSSLVTPPTPHAEHTIGISPYAASSQPNLQFYNHDYQPPKAQTPPTSILPSTSKSKLFNRDRTNSSSLSPIALRSFLPSTSRPTSPADLRTQPQVPGFSPSPTPSSSMPLLVSTTGSKGSAGSAPGTATQISQKPSSSGKKRPPSMPGLGKWSFGGRKSSEGAEGEGEEKKEEGTGRRSWLKSRGKDREKEKEKNRRSEGKVRERATSDSVTTSTTSSVSGRNVSGEEERTGMVGEGEYGFHSGPLNTPVAHAHPVTVPSDNPSPMHIRVTHYGNHLKSWKHHCQHEAPTARTEFTPQHYKPTHRFTMPHPQGPQSELGPSHQTSFGAAFEGWGAVGGWPREDVEAVGGGNVAWP